MLIKNIQGGAKEVIRCCLALIFFLNEKLRFCFLIMFIYTFRINCVKSRRWYRTNGRRHNWLPYGLVLWHFPSLRRAFRAINSRIRVGYFPWGLPRSQACWCKHGTSKNPIKRSPGPLNRAIWRASANRQNARLTHHAVTLSGCNGSSCITRGFLVP